MVEETAFERFGHALRRGKDTEVGRVLGGYNWQGNERMSLEMTRG